MWNRLIGNLITKVYQKLQKYPQSMWLRCYLWSCMSYYYCQPCFSDLSFVADDLIFVFFCGFPGWSCDRGQETLLQALSIAPTDGQIRGRRATGSRCPRPPQSQHRRSGRKLRKCGVRLADHQEMSTLFVLLETSQSKKIPKCVKRKWVNSVD